MADNIVLIGLVYDDNLGDQAIAFSSKNIIEEYLYKKGIKADLRLLDLQGRKKCPDNEQRKENINASKQHNDVAEQVHKFNFLKIIEDDSHEIEDSTKNKHAETF